MIDGGPGLGLPPDPAIPAADGLAATRVHVDQDGPGVFVYRLVDVASGRVLVELPRERADELGTVPGYGGGALLSASA